jgi:hypothetical protein
MQINFTTKLLSCPKEGMDGVMEIGEKAPMIKSSLTLPSFFSLSQLKEIKLQSPKRAGLYVLNSKAASSK